ncbi:F-box protein SKIP22-like [Impatiens glandulifera]|uniref:F-box protein SKIP22-like n=1 Tax=Impatiens glandulifera TaxID=253017 RepID=UPI001FB166B0|nr:F-box protein SKIP22-like [Impatiens glandulifera]
MVTFTPQDTLPSLGITSDDPVFASPPSFSETLGIENIAITIDPQDSEEKSSTETDFMIQSSAVCEIRDNDTLSANIENFDTKPEDMDIDDSIPEARKDFSVPFFLRKIFREEIGDSTTGGGVHRLIAIAVHAVLIDSGFVAFDPVSNKKIERFHLPNEFFSSEQTLSLCYTLPEIIDEKMETQTAVLKFQGLGKYMSIYGSLTKNGYGTHWVRFDKNRLSFFLNLVWANFDLAIELADHAYPQKEVFEFWKTVKDKLALPLLIDLCDRAGLTPPPCFMRLPIDIKLIILKALPGNDLAKTACVCSELRYLCSNDEDLWKQKYEEQFGSGTATDGQWKYKFGKSWEQNRKSGVLRSALRMRIWPYTVWGPRRNVHPVWGSEFEPQFRFY